MKSKIILSLLCILVASCTYEINIPESPSLESTLNQVEYFGDVNEIDPNDALKQQQNQRAQFLVLKLQALKHYMGTNKERLSIKAWHDIDERHVLIQSDTITQANSLSSYDGFERMQIASYNNRDYFWKTNTWFLFFGIADTVSQSSDHTNGHHGYLPTSVDNFYDNINWYRKEDSLVLTIKRTGGWGRINESLWINTKTKTGKFLFQNREIGSDTEIYYWYQDGSGTYDVEDWNGVVTRVESW